ncbi:PQE-1 protein [Aphelenchoides avenae]|nr:PQE-1 protein [Aphelenchus avenae]
MASVGQFYDQLTPFLVTDAQLRDNEYPMWLEEGREVAVVQNNYSLEKSPIAEDQDNQRICRRCWARFDITKNAAGECNHHPQRASRNKGETESRHPCCNAPFGSTGCITSRYHVTHQFTAASLFQYVQTPVPTANDARSKSVYALDVELVYTSSGSEIARLTLVGYDGDVKLDAVIRPDNAIVDCNTVYSGLTQAQLDNAAFTLETARDALFKFVNRDTILIGHGLENDFKALRLVHEKVVDTSLEFPREKAGTKWSLKQLAHYHLRTEIQQGQHCSAEDARTCMKLMRQKV